MHRTTISNPKHPPRKAFLATAALLVALCLAGCSDSNCRATADTAADSLASDRLNIDSLEQLYGNNVMPLAADELFDDFFFNFAASGKLQRQRIAFPLKVISHGKERFMEQSAWKVDHFYLDQGYCTGIFSDAQEAGLMGDTSVIQAAVQRIHLDNRKVDNFHFMKLKGAWMLIDLTETVIDSIAHADFLSFYARFAGDEAFQRQSLHSPVTTTVNDPESYDGTISGNFYPEQWHLFKPPVMPDKVMYNIIYATNGITRNPSLLPKRKVDFIIRGMANGLATTMKFEKDRQQWQLTAIES